MAHVGILEAMVQKGFSRIHIEAFTRRARLPLLESNP